MVSELVKVPVPLPSVVQLSPVAGLDDMLQHTPLAVTGAPPSEVMLPPQVAVVEVMAEMASVVSVGTTAPAVNWRSVPLVVPTSLVATSL